MRTACIQNLCAKNFDLLKLQYKKAQVPCTPSQENARKSATTCAKKCVTDTQRWNSNDATSNR